MRVPVDIPHAGYVKKMPDNYYVGWNTELRTEKIQRMFEIKFRLTQDPDEKTKEQLTREYDYIADRVQPPEV